MTFFLNTLLAASRAHFLKLAAFFWFWVLQFNGFLELSTADIIGIVVGAVGAFIIALVLILFLIQRKLDEVNLKMHVYPSPLVRQLLVETFFSSNHKRRDTRCFVSDR